MIIKEYIKEYKALTLDIMERANEDGSIEYLVNERQVILEKIMALDVDKDNLREISKSVNLLQLEKELEQLIKKEIIITKKKIEKTKKMYNANIKYSAIQYVPSRFNREI